MGFGSWDLFGSIGNYWDLGFNLCLSVFICGYLTIPILKKGVKMKRGFNLINLLTHLLLTTLLLLALCFSSLCLAQSQPRKTILENGLTILTKENHSSDIVALEVFIKVGASAEDEEKAGISNFIQELLLSSKEEIIGEIESLGGIIDTTVSSDYAELFLLLPSEYFSKAFKLFSELLKTPKFDPEEIERKRKIILQQIKAEEDELFDSTYNLFRETLYQGSPYHKPVLGYKETIEGIKREDLLNFYKTYYVPNNMIISVSGDFITEELIKEIEEHFKELKSGQLPLRQIKRPKEQTEHQEVIKERESESAWLILGFPAPKAKSKDYPALKLIDCILGSEMSSRLFVNLREKLGLAYEVGSFFPSQRDAGHFATYIITSPRQIDKVKSGIIWEIAKLKQMAVSEEELEEAKKCLLGTFIMDHERNKKQAFYLGFYELLGVGYLFDEEYPQKIEAVTSLQIKRVAQRYFQNYTLAVIMPGGK